MRNLIEILSMLVWATGLLTLVYFAAIIVSKLGWWVL